MPNWGPSALDVMILTMVLNDSALAMSPHRGPMIKDEWLPEHRATSSSENANLGAYFPWTTIASPFFNLIAMIPDDNFAKFSVGLGNFSRFVVV